MKLSKVSKYLLLASFIGTFSEQMLLPYWSSFVNKVGGDLMDAGIGFAIFSITTGIFVVTIGQTKWFELHTKSLLLWGFIISGIGEFSYFFVVNKWELFFVQCIVGISVGILNPCWDKMYAEEEDDSQAGKKWSFWNGGVSFVIGVASLVSAAIVSIFSFHALFITMGIIDVFAVYFAYKAIHE